MTAGKDDSDNPREVECTALDRSGDVTTANALFTPPCACPRCAPQRFDDEPGPGVIWVPVDGRPVRHQVDDMTLGTTGQNLLG